MFLLQFAQIENEYDHVRGAFKGGAAERYIHWAGRMALAQKTGVPWMMCEQKDAPGEVVTLFYSYSFMYILFYLKKLWQSSF